jgi:menaquinone-dependent protoporphyrinogen oxidase
MKNLPEIKVSPQVNKKVMIAYATRFGSTGEIAKAIAKELGKWGVEVDVQPVREVDDISSYGSVIIGSPIFYGKILPEVKKFLKRYEETLAQKRVACFLTGMEMHRIADEPFPIPVFLDSGFEDQPKPKSEMGFWEKAHAVSVYLSPLMKKVPKVKLIEVGCFKGKLDFRGLSGFGWLIMKLIVKFRKEIQEGDFRNWEAIRSWSAEMCSKLLSENKN